MRQEFGLVIITLGLVAVVGLCGMVWLAVTGRPADAVTPIVATAVGALASILARGEGKDQA